MGKKDAKGPTGQKFSSSQPIRTEMGKKGAGAGSSTTSNKPKAGGKK